MLSNGNYPTSVYPDNLYPDWNQLTQRFCGSQWIKWIRNLKMNSKIKLIKVERILVQVVPRFSEMMMIGEPPNHRTVQRDDLRIAQHFWGDWSPLRSSTIIPSPVHSKLIKHPMPMVPMWKFPTSTMVSFRVFFWTGEGITKKIYAFPFRMRHTVPGGSRCKEPTKISQIFGTIFGGLILGDAII